MSWGFGVGGFERFSLDAGRYGLGVWGWGLNTFRWTLNALCLCAYAPFLYYYCLFPIAFLCAFFRLALFHSCLLPLPYCLAMCLFSLYAERLTLCASVPSSLFGIPIASSLLPFYVPFFALR